MSHRSAALRLRELQVLPDALKRRMPHLPLPCQSAIFDVDKHFGFEPLRLRLLIFFLQLGNDKRPPL
jgi:hypothetical protein